MISFADLSLADHHRSAQGRVHFINAVTTCPMFAHWRGAEGEDDGDVPRSPSRARRRARLRYGPAALDNTNEDHDHGNDEEDMDEASKRVGGDHP